PQSWDDDEKDAWQVFTFKNLFEQEHWRMMTSVDRAALESIRDQLWC
ncbi:unnamed protein product, partial [marine sediment metagenome]